jgi:hypothetical protein
MMAAKWAVAMLLDSEASKWGARLRVHMLAPFGLIIRNYSIKNRLSGVNGQPSGLSGSLFIVFSNFSGTIFGHALSLADKLCRP